MKVLTKEKGFQADFQDTRSIIYKEIKLNQVSKSNANIYGSYMRVL